MIVELLTDVAAREMLQPVKCPRCAAVVTLLQLLLNSRRPWDDAGVELLTAAATGEMLQPSGL